MNNEKVYLKGYVVGHSADTLGYKGLQIQLENMDIVEVDENLVYKISDEPQKVTVPQFVADYIEFKKENDFHIYGAMRVIEDHYDKRVPEWFYKKNIETFARAWLDGYTVEKEKRYLVNVKNVRTRQGTLNRSKRSGAFIFSNPEENNLYGTKFTRTELEQAGFGWVFDCPGVEVEEVEG